ncbi:MAG TPA: 3-hydroxyacyl-ACP dehydratase FabZ [Planctomicrobium sp.]|nr:3-hydroxyacyl-ACP dehydratase FabZ [Planctomicrobium sp.]
MSEPISLPINREAIQQLIPHRDPFLWLDEVVELSPEKIVAHKRVPEDLDVFRGHYPHFPVLPGVLQCEAAFQAGAVLIASQFPPTDGQVPVVTRLNNVQFRKMVSPGQTLVLEVELTEKMTNAFFLKGKVSVDGKVCVRLEFACALAEPQR